MTLSGNFLFLLIALSVQELCVGREESITSGLINFLFDGYKAELLPVCRAGENVKIKLDIALRQIINLNEKQQSLTTNVWIRMNWDDCRLGWNESDYYGVGLLIVPYENVWMPDLALYDSCAEEEMMPGRDQYRAQISADGSIQYNFPTVLKSICRVQVTYFPFDIQTCTLKFGSWSYSMNDVDLALVDATGDLSVYIPNTEWEISNLPGQKMVTDYNGTKFADIRYNIIMKRRPTFYVMTMLFPCILTSAIATIGFLLPSESGEKVSLEITVLLSLAVFLLVISDFLPPSSETFPVIGSYFAVSMVLVSLSLLMSIAVLNVHYRGEMGRRMPKWAKRIFVDCLGQCCSKKSSKYNLRNGFGKAETARIHGARSKPEVRVGMDMEMGSSNGHLVSQESTNLPLTRGERSRTACSLPPLSSSLALQAELAGLLECQARCIQHLEKYFMEKEGHQEICEEWQKMARVLDRLFLIVYVAVSLIVFLTFLLQFELT